MDILYYNDFLIRYFIYLLIREIKFQCISNEPNHLYLYTTTYFQQIIDSFINSNQLYLKYQSRM